MVCKVGKSLIIFITTIFTIGSTPKWRKRFLCSQPISSQLQSWFHIKIVQMRIAVRSFQKQNTPRYSDYYRRHSKQKSLQQQYKRYLAWLRSSATNFVAEYRSKGKLFVVVTVAKRVFVISTSPYSLGNLYTSINISSSMQDGTFKNYSISLNIEVNKK